MYGKCSTCYTVTLAPDNFLNVVEFGILLNPNDVSGVLDYKMKQVYLWVREFQD